MRPTWAATWARFTATVVFPVPPFPLAMAIFMEAESTQSSLLPFATGALGGGDFVDPASDLIQCGSGRLRLRPQHLKLDFLRHRLSEASLVPAASAGKPIAARLPAGQAGGVEHVPPPSAPATTASTGTPPAYSRERRIRRRSRPCDLSSVPFPLGPVRSPPGMFVLLS